MMRSKKRNQASNSPRHISAVLLGQDGVGKSGKELLVSTVTASYQLLIVSDEILAKLQPQHLHLFVKVLVEI